MNDSTPLPVVSPITVTAFKKDKRGNIEDSGGKKGPEHGHALVFAGYHAFQEHSPRPPVLSVPFEVGAHRKPPLLTAVSI